MQDGLAMEWFVKDIIDPQLQAHMLRANREAESQKAQGSRKGNSPPSPHHHLLTTLQPAMAPIASTPTMNNGIQQVLQELHLLKGHGNSLVILNSPTKDTSLHPVCRPTTSSSW